MPQTGQTETARLLPPGQHVARGWPVLHYGPVPRFRPEAWDLRVFGAVRDFELRWTWPDVARLPRVDVVADLHCVTRFSMLGNRWHGIPAAAVLEACPPDDAVTHVMVWAEYGYSTNLSLDDFTRSTTVLATHHDGVPLTPEHGYPLRLVVPHLYGWKGPKWLRGVEYLVGDRRGFWEERGYHNVGDPWQEQRYSYQEDSAPDSAP